MNSNNDGKNIDSMGNNIDHVSEEYRSRSRSQTNKRYRGGRSRSKSYDSGSRSPSHSKSSRGRGRGRSYSRSRSRSRSNNRERYATTTTASRTINNRHDRTSFVGRDARTGGNNFNAGRNACYDYLAGICKWGENCRYGHPEGLKGTDPHAGPNNGGRGSTGDTRMMNDDFRGFKIAHRSSNACYDFYKGLCTRQGTCHYSHRLSDFADGFDVVGDEGGIVNSRTTNSSSYNDRRDDNRFGVKNGGLCYDFQQRGTCPRGPLCRFSHDNLLCKKMNEEKEQRRDNESRKGPSNWDRRNSSGSASVSRTPKLDRDRGNGSSSRDVIDDEPSSGWTNKYGTNKESSSSNTRDTKGKKYITPSSEHKDTSHRSNMDTKHSSNTNINPTTTDWKKVLEPKSGEFYYWDKVSGKVQWETPSTKTISTKREHY